MEDCKNILIVDDSEIDKWLIVKILEINNINVNIISADNGIVALNLLNEFSSANNALPQLMLVDIQMPMMNGFEFIKRVKKHNLFSKDRTRIAVLTSDFDEEKDSGYIKELNIEYVLIKPIETEFLLQLI